MNKLITTHNNGMPDFLDNFRWYEDGVNEALANIIKGLSNGQGALILHGANTVSSGSNYVISAGAIFFNGEVFTVPAHTLPKLPTGEPGTYYWNFEESFEPEGFLDFADGTPNDCYAIRVAKLMKTSEVLTPGSFVDFEVKRFSEVYTLRSTFNILQDAHINLLQAFNQLRSEVGGAYFYASFQNESTAYFDMPWVTAFGALRSNDADIKMVNGGLYEVNILKSPNGSSFRLYHNGGLEGLNIDYELAEGVNLFHLNGYAGEHHIRLQGKYIDGNTEVIVRLVAMDTNPSSNGDGGVVVNPG